MGRRLVIVSEVPGPEVSSALIEGRSLYRLTILMGLSHASEVHRRYDARNLIPTPDPAWGNGHGRRSRIQAAAEMLPSLIGAPVVMLGNNVATAFGLMPRPFCEWREAKVDVGVRRPVRLLYATVPHPSSSNRTFNDRAAMGVVTNFLRRVRDEEADGSLYAKADEAAAEYVRAMRREEVDQLLSITDVATILGVPLSRVSAMVAEKKIGHMRGAGGPRFRWADIRAYEAAYHVPMNVFVVPNKLKGRAVRVIAEAGEARGRIVRKKMSTCVPGNTLGRTG